MFDDVFFLVLWFVVMEGVVFMVLFVLLLMLVGELFDERVLWIVWDVLSVFGVVLMMCEENVNLCCVFDFDLLD